MEKTKQKKLEKLNKIAPHIEPTEQSKKIAQEITKKINVKDIKTNINKGE